MRYLAEHMYEWMLWQLQHSAAENQITIQLGPEGAVGARVDVVVEVEQWVQLDVVQHRVQEVGVLFRQKRGSWISWLNLSIERLSNSRELDDDLEVDDVLHNDDLDVLDEVGVRYLIGSQFLLYII